MRIPLHLVATAILLIGSPVTLLAEVAYSRFLLPLYTEAVPGAYGSLWQMDAWIRYQGT